MGPFATIAAQLLEQCKHLDDHLETTSKPAVAVGDEDGDLFDNYLLQDLPADLSKTRSSVVDLTQKLRQLALDPVENIRETTFGFTNVLTLQAVTRFGLAEKVPLDGEATFAAVADSTGIDGDLARRFMQHAATRRIFRQTGPSTVRHTAASRLLATSPLLRDEVGYVVDEMNPAGMHTLAALAKYPGPNGATSEQNKTGFSLSNNTADPLFIEMSKTASRIRRFGGAMRSMTDGDGCGIHHLVDGYDWASVAQRSARVVDIGGGQGAVSCALATAYPTLKCVVQDLPFQTGPGAAALPAALADRVSFVAHDFFAPQTEPADIFILRWILHNWSDKYCVKIIQALVPALKPGSRVVVCEYILPEIAQPGSHADWYRRTGDLVMLSALAAAERSTQQFVKLFQAADPAFRLVSTVEKPEAALSTLVMEYAGPEAAK